MKSAFYSLFSFLIPTFTIRKLLTAGGVATEKFLKVRPLENLFLAFNNIKNPEGGESDEFTTIGNIQTLLKKMGVPDGTSVIGIGARTGHPDQPYATPGEMGYLWKLGEPWNGKVTSIVDAKPVPLHLDDPIAVTQVGVLHENTAHHLDIDDPSLEGSVLWTFYNDETGSDIIDAGMHNLFSDVDGGMLETIYDTSQTALKRPNSWATSSVRKKLTKFIPNLASEKVWGNFSKTLAKPFVHSEWLDYVKEQGWEGAAVVLKGSLQNVAQFHLTEWVRKSPQDPEFEIGKGTHTILKIKAGREVRPFITNKSGDWTMVGFIWDLQNKDATPSMTTYRDFSDIFGQDFHIHGFKDDQSIGGHTLFAMLGSGKLKVSLYPLTFQNQETAFLFNNDLLLIRDSIVQGNTGLAVQVKNNGENCVRDLSLRLSKRGLFGTHSGIENVTIPFMAPGQVIRVKFTGSTAMSYKSKRTLWLDRDGHFIEGGQGTANNRLDF